MKFAIVLALAAAAMAAQSLQVYSELADVDGAGGAHGTPREILSPALARNAFNSFLIVVRVAPGTPYWLYLGENPEDAVKVTLYRRDAGGLQQLSSPYNGDSTQVFRLDLWVERNAAVRRIKIEPELFVNDDWITYPMEARVMETTVPDGEWPDGSAAPAAVMKNFLCESPMPKGGGGAEARLRFRNARQDAALAGHAPKAELLRLTGGCGAAEPADPEGYLKIRDYLFRMR